MRIPVCLVCAALTVGLMGCGREAALHEEADSEATAQQLFEKGKGVRLPEEMAKAFGVETVEVTSKTFVERVEVAATVYQSATSNTTARATALLNAAEAAGLKIGQMLNLRPVEDAGAKGLPGRLTKLESQAAAFGQVEALIEFNDADGQHEAGTSLLAIFTGPERKADHAVPATAVLQGAETHFVYSVNGAHFVRTPIKVGARGSGWVEVTDGLYGGDVIVVRGADEMWMIELCALKGGTPCCPVGKRPGRVD